MKILEALNKPLTLSSLSRKYTTDSRPLTDEEILLLKKEMDSLEKNSKIMWGSLGTYTPSLFLALFFLLISKKAVVFAGAFTVFFTVLKILPSILKGDRALLKKDLLEGVAIIKRGPVTIIEDAYNGMYMKRSFIDGVTIDAIHSPKDSMKYPELVDGQEVEVVYSPNANYIFSVRKLE